MSAGTEAPEVVGPEDVPGADVVWYDNVEYTLDATGSTDNVGIVLFEWVIEDPSDVEITISSTTPTAKWTPTSPGIYRVISWAEDAAGNRGYYVYAIDVAEVLPAGTIADTTLVRDHSLVVYSGQAELDNVKIRMSGGRSHDTFVMEEGEMLTEDVYYTAISSLAGHWEPYYTGSTGGRIERDTTTVFTGKASIKNTGGTSNQGFTYVFDSPADLTSYNIFKFWLHGEYSSAYFYNIYFVTSSGSYWNYMYTSPARGTLAEGWLGISVSLDPSNVGRTTCMTSYLRNTESLRIYFYQQSYDCWIDGAYFAEETFADNITESSRPSGDWAGYWSYVNGYTSGTKMVGKYSVMDSHATSTYNNIRYTWNTPVDLSSFDALRMFTYYRGNYVRLDRVRLADGDYDYVDFYRYSSNYLHYYATYNYANWYLANIPWGPEFYTENPDFDWDRIKYMQMYTYSYTSVGTQYLYMDGLEFYKAKAPWTPPPVLTEDIPVGIYAVENGYLTMKRCDLSYSGSLGTFINSQNDLILDGCTLSGLYGWRNLGLPSPLKAAGGIMANNCDVTLRNVVVTSAAASAIHLIDCNLTAEKLDISGIGNKFSDSAGMVLETRSGSLGIPYTITIQDSKFKNSYTASGFVIAMTDAHGGVDITLDDVRAESNGRYGGIITTTGYYGPISVDIVDSTFSSNSMSGMYFYLTKAYYYAGAEVLFEITSTEFAGNRNDGLRIEAIESEIDMTVTARNSYFQTNSGSGIYNMISGLRGWLTLDLEDTAVDRNNGNGLYMRSTQQSFGSGKPDIDPRFQFVPLQDEGPPVCWVDVLLERVTFDHNRGSGIYDWYYLNGPYNNPDQPTLFYDLQMRNSSISNNGYGCQVYASNPYCGQRDGTYLFQDSEIVNNNNDGFYFFEDAYTYYRNSGYLENVYRFINCTIEDNYRGIRQYFYSYGNGQRAKVFVEGCTIMDNPGSAIWAYGSKTTSGGTSYLLHSVWDVRNCTIGNRVNLDISGASSSYGNHDDVYIIINFVDNKYASNDPIFIGMSAYYAEYTKPLSVSLVYRNNEHSLPILGDALTIEAFGGTVLNANIIIENNVFVNVFEDGINVLLGTLYTSSIYSRSLVGNILIQDVTISKCMDTGVNFNILHTSAGAVLNKARFIMKNVTIENAGSGLYSEGVNGELIDCSFTNIRTRAIIVSSAIVDVFTSNIGEVDERNLFVDLAGAIRLWYDLTVNVVWEDTGEHVIGVNLELKDNSWDIKGIQTQSSQEGVRFVNLNSHTVLSNGLYTKNPYIVKLNFRGLLKEEKLTVKGPTQVTITLIDDVLPRLYIESPKEGVLSRDTEIVVMGSSYDMHTGMEVVEVSIDGETWFEAEGTDIFTYTFENVEEGLSVIRVRACDITGNIKEGTVSVYIDRTPPSLAVYTPVNGTRTRFVNMEVVGVTDVDATVYINSQPVDKDYTLISHLIRLNEGLNEIKVAVYDNLGNVRTEVRTVTLDTHSPYIEMTTDDQVVRDKVFLLQGLTEPGDVSISIEDEDIPVDYKGRFETEVDLVEGKNVFDIQSTDGVGNHRMVSVTITLDNTPPWFMIESPIEGTVYNDRNVMVAGYIEEGARVYVNDREILPAFGQFVTHEYVPEGVSEITVVGIDGAGNFMESVITVRVDSIAPIIELDYPMSGIATNKESVQVKGWIQDQTEDYSDIELFVNDMPWPVDKVEGMFMGEVSLEEGYNRIIITAWDAALNKGRMELSVTRDSTAPFLDVMLKGVHTDPQWNEPVADRSFAYVTGFTELGATVMANGVYMEVDPDSGYFNQTVEIPAPLPGKKIYALSIEVTSADEAGNVATQTVVVNRIEGVEAEDVSSVSIAEWLVLFLAMIILGIALVGAYGYQRMKTQEEVIESFETQPTTIVVAESERPSIPPPNRPKRGGVPRQRPMPPEEEGEVVLEIEDEEVE